MTDRKGANVHIRRAFELMSTDALEEAYNELKLALDLDPENKQAWEKLISLSSSIGCDDECMSMFEQVMVNPYPAIHVIGGLALNLRYTDDRHEWSKRLYRYADTVKRKFGDNKNAMSLLYDQVLAEMVLLEAQLNERASQYDIDGPAPSG